MNNIDWFNFEDKDLDFPVYRKNPHFSKTAWIILFVASFVGLIVGLGSHIINGVLWCAIVLVPLLYFLKWDYKAIFQIPKAKDVALAVALFIGYMVYAILITVPLEYLGLVGSDLVGETSWMSLPPLIFSLMGEELLKFIPFIFFLRLFFKFSQKRKLSVVMSVILVMIFFAALHSYDLPTLLFALVVQGFGSIFEFFGYIKTKNILVSYITHLCTDVFIFIIVIMGVG